MKAPYIPAEVLEWLEDQFPNRLPEEPVTKETYDVLVGRQQVVQRVRREFDRQDLNSVLGG